MKKVYAFLIAVGSFSFSFSQNPSFTWAKLFGGAGNAANGKSVISDVNGNIYTCGIFNGTVDFDPGVGVVNLTSARSIDIFICKIDANGNFIWAKRVGGAGADQANSITIDVNVIIVGPFQGTADLDPGAGTFNLTSSGSGTVFNMTNRIKQ